MQQQQNQNPGIVQQYVADIIQRDYSLATGQPVPLEVAARITQTEALAQTRLSPQQLAEAEQLVNAERMHQQGQLMAEHDHRAQEQQLNSAEDRLAKLTANHTRDGQGLTFEQLQQYKKTGKYTPTHRQPVIDPGVLEAGARERGMTPTQFKEAMFDLDLNADNADRRLKELDMDRETATLYKEHWIDLGMEERFAKSYEPPEDIDGAQGLDMRLDILNATAENSPDAIGAPDIHDELLEEDGVRGDVARAMAAHSED